MYNVFDAGPTLYKCYINDLCSLGCTIYSDRVLAADSSIQQHNLALGYVPHYRLRIASVCIHYVMESVLFPCRQPLRDAPRCTVVQPVNLCKWYYYLSHSTAMTDISRLTSITPHIITKNYICCSHQSLKQYNVT